MAKPRIFISSTFYDLKHIRADLERFINEMGYDAVLNERGTIPYAKVTSKEDCCLKEVDLCDMLIAVIGGRFGTGSHNEPYSISQSEIKQAIDLGKQVFIFVEKNVLAEFSTYKANIGNKQINYSHVDNVQVYKFIDEIQALPKNNAIMPFEIPDDITSYLKKQWAGLFQRLMQEETRREEISVIKELKIASETLNQLVTYLTEEKKDQNEAIQAVLLYAHPAFQRLKKLLKVSYRVFFLNIDELSTWLKVRKFNAVSREHWESPEYQEWRNDDELPLVSILKIAVLIFDDGGKLKIMSKDEWKDDYIKLEKHDITDDIEPFDPEDIPF